MHLIIIEYKTANNRPIGPLFAVISTLVHMNPFKKIDKRLLAAEGTALAVFAAFSVKAIGALYKIPLYNLLGNIATGLYGMVFPLFSFLLCLSGGAAPSALAKIISDGYDGRKTLKIAATLFCPFAAILSLALYIFADKIALLQGALTAAALYRTIAPSVFFVSVLSVLRGYFQGLFNMKPTAISRLIEQMARAALGLSACIFLSVSAEEKARLSVLAVTLSELFALLYCLFTFLKKNTTARGIVVGENLNNPSFKLVLSFALPLTLADLLFPLSAFLVETVAVRALTSLFGADGLGIYGLYSGATESVVCLPAAVLYPLTAGLLPKMKEEGVAERAVFFSLAGGALAAAFCLLFPKFIVGVLFFKVQNKTLLEGLIRLSSLSVFALPLLQALSTVMLSKGAQTASLINNAVGAAVKIAVCYMLVNQRATSCFALAISDICCYFVALSLNLLYIISINKRIEKVEGRSDNDDNISGTGHGQGRNILGRVKGN